MIKSKKHLFFILKIQNKEFQNIIDNIEIYYKEFKKLKFDDKGILRRDKLGIPVFREICPSLEPLKTIQKRIQTNILANISFPEFIQGGIKNRDNVSNARSHLGKKYHFITDLKNFFPSIRPKLVYDTFIKHGFSADVSHILTKLTTYKNQLPQGASTSTYIANMVFLKTDDDLHKFCLQKGIIYSRFIDDLVFSSQNDFKSITNEIIEIVKKSKFKINNKKTKYKIGPALITGVFTKNNVLDITEDFKIKLKNSKDKPETVIKGYKNYYNKVRKRI